jgi:hypothetical protein
VTETQLSALRWGAGGAPWRPAQSLERAGEIALIGNVLAAIIACDEHRDQNRSQANGFQRS